MSGGLPSPYAGDPLAGSCPVRHSRSVVTGSGLGCPKPLNARRRRPSIVKGGATEANPQLRVGMLTKMTTLELIDRFICANTILWYASPDDSRQSPLSPEHSRSVGDLITWIHWHNFQLRDNELESASASAVGREFRPDFHKEALVDAIDDLDALMGVTCGEEAENGNSVGSLMDMISSANLEIFHLVRSEGWRDVDRLNKLLGQYFSLKVCLVALVRDRATAWPAETPTRPHLWQMVCTSTSGQPFDYYLE